MVAATLALAVVGGAAWVTGGDSPDREPALLLVRLNDDTDTVQVFGLDGTLQRTVQLPEGTVDNVIDYFGPDRQPTLVFWNDKSHVLTRVDPATGEIRTLELPTAGLQPFTWLTSTGVLTVQTLYQSPLLVDTTSMQLIDLEARLPGVTAAEVGMPFDVAGSALILSQDRSGMVVFPAQSPSEPWFAEGLVVDHSTAGSVAWVPSDDTVRLLTADGQVGETIQLPFDNDARLDEWSADAVVVRVRGENSLWRLDFDAGEARRVMDLPLADMTLLPHQRLIVVDRQENTATLYDLDGKVVAEFADDGEVAAGRPSAVSEFGTECRVLTYFDIDAVFDRAETTVIVRVETGEVIAALLGELGHQSSDGCSAVTSDPDGRYAFHDGRTTEFGEDVEFDREMDWAVEETDEGDFLVDLSTGQRSELPPGEGSYLFIAPATVEAQNAT